MNSVQELYQQTDWLYTKIYQNSFFFFDLWTLVHLWSGFGLYLIARVLKLKQPFMMSLAGLVAYELLEIAFLYFALSVFRPETLKDQLTDIGIGMAGALAAMYLLRLLNRYAVHYPKLTDHLIAFYVSTSFAFVWVGFYGYQYNYSFMNSRGINYWALSWSVLFQYMVILLYLFFARFGKIKAVLITYTVYIIVLLTLEYIGYYHAGMHEISRPGSKALVFGIIHGTTALHISYLLAPFITIALFYFARAVICRARQ